MRRDDLAMAVGKGHSGHEVLPDEQLARARWRPWAVVAAVVLFVIAAALVLLAVGVPLPGVSGGALAWRTGAGFALSAVGLAISGVGIYRMARAGVFDTRAQAVVASLPRERRREAVRAVRRGEAVPQDLMPVATAMAAALIRQGQAAVLYAGIAVTGLGTAQRADGPLVLTVVGLGVVALMAVAIPLLYRDTRLARRWLAAHSRQAKGWSARS